MKLIKTNIEGVVILESRLFNDERGYFCVTHNKQQLDALLGREITFVQDNQSRSKAGVVRGLHYQQHPYAQSKLVRVVRGKILDIAVDIRRGSPTFGRYVGVELSEDNHRQLFIPRGFAHGFAVLEGDAIVEYKCDNDYSPAAERTIAWNDPDIGIEWGIDTERVIISAKDADGVALRDAELFDYNEDYYA
ncbi:MAG: dTDP-4-dehydrorhamnose 3,5-epimerase [Alistipes sp.]|nr:dTDP-4-dehydrorhamnose 3,5-epimerase [Alistipes sp.]